METNEEETLETKKTETNDLFKVLLLDSNERLKKAEAKIEKLQKKNEKLEAEIATLSGELEGKNAKKRERKEETLVKEEKDLLQKMAAHFALFSYDLIPLSTVIQFAKKFMVTAIDNPNELSEESVEYYKKRFVKARSAENTDFRENMPFLEELKKIDSNKILENLFDGKSKVLSSVKDISFLIKKLINSKNYEQKTDQMSWNKKCYRFFDKKFKKWNLGEKDLPTALRSIAIQLALKLAPLTPIPTPSKAAQVCTVFFFILSGNHGNRESREFSSTIDEFKEEDVSMNKIIRLSMNSQEISYFQKAETKWEQRIFLKEKENTREENDNKGESESSGSDEKDTRKKTKENGKKKK